MKLSLMLLYENLKMPETTLQIYQLPGPLFDGIRILTNSEETLDARYLYVELYPYAENYRTNELADISVVCSENSPIQNYVKNGIFISNKFSIYDIFNNLTEIFDRFNSWENKTKDALIEKEPLENVLNLCRMVTRETVYVTNLSLKMIAHTKPTIMSDISAIWQYQEKYGYMPMHVVKTLIDTKEIDRINSYPYAFSSPTTAFNLPYTCRNIFIDNVIRAHIFIVSIYQKPLQTNKEIADLLGQLFTVFIRDHTDFFSTTGLFHEHFFKDVLSAKLQDRSLIQQQLSSINWNIEDGFLVFAMKIQQTSQEAFRIFNHSMERAGFDFKSIEFSDDYVTIFHIKRNSETIQNIQKKAGEFLDRQNIRGAFSKWFPSFKDIRIYHQQVQAVLSFCEHISCHKNLLIEEEFGIYSFIKAGLENHSSFEVCHPDVIFLYEYDKKNLTDYIDTLFQYLINDRNVVKAAKSLFIHRNTMNYRLEKIKGLADFDEENQDIRSYVLLSIYILKYVLQTNYPDPDIH